MSNEPKVRLARLLYGFDPTTIYIALKDPPSAYDNPELVVRDAYGCIVEHFAIADEEDE